mmetsp:Transcript_40701/g.100566  ORF Transcript_40701/g.100566 Transcript_40701/m.100566 type:complete len:311 (-) Transcript_40701:108-1040(-)
MASSDDWNAWSFASSPASCRRALQADSAVAGAGEHATETREVIACACVSSGWYIFSEASFSKISAACSKSLAARGLSDASPASTIESSVTVARASRRASSMAAEPSGPAGAAASAESAAPASSRAAGTRAARSPARLSASSASLPHAREICCSRAGASVGSKQPRARSERAVPSAASQVAELVCSCVVAASSSHSAEGSAACASASASARMPRLLCESAISRAMRRSRAGSSSSSWRPEWKIANPPGSERSVRCSDCTIAKVHAPSLGSTATRRSCTRAMRLWLSSLPLMAMRPAASTCRSKQAFPSCFS